MKRPFVVHLIGDLRMIWKGIFLYFRDKTQSMFVIETSISTAIFVFLMIFFQQHNNYQNVVMGLFMLYSYLNGFVALYNQKIGTIMVVSILILQFLLRLFFYMIFLSNG